MDRDALEQNQIPIYFVAVIAAAIGGFMAPVAAQGLNALVTPTIAVLMYAMFLQIPFLNLREGLSNRRFMSALLIANFVLIPLLVWGLTRGLTDHPAILVGALLVLLTPCIDYVVVFTHIGKGDSRGILAATPILLLLQLVLLPVYLAFMLGGQSEVMISVGPFVEAFLVLIVAPLLLAVVTAALAKSRKSSVVGMPPGLGYLSQQWLRFWSRWSALKSPRSFATSTNLLRSSPYTSASCYWLRWLALWLRELSSCRPRLPEQ